MVQRLTPQKLERQMLSRKLTRRSVERLNLKAQQQQQTEFKKSINEIEKALLNTATVNEAIELYNSLDPGIRNSLKVDPRVIMQDQANRIKNLKNEYQDKLKKVDRYDERGDEATGDRRAKYKAKEASYKKEAKELDKIIKEMESSGTRYTISQVKRYINDVGDAEYDRKLNKARRNIEKQNLLESGNITKISYSNGKPVSAVVNGKSLSLKGLDTKTVQLTSVKFSKIKDIEDKINKGQALTVEDFKKAQQLGIDSKQLLGVAGEAFKTQKELKLLKEKQAKASINNIDKAFSNAGLSFIVKAFTPSQKKDLLTNLTNRQIAELSAVELNKKLNPIQKETQKRKILGIDNEDLLQTKITNNKLKKKIFNAGLKVTELENINNKFITGQTLTPKEQVEYFTLKRLEAKDLSKKQQDLAKKILLSPLNYSSSLALRSRAGESSPLYNDLKGIGLGFAKEVGDTINFITGVKDITINSRGETYDGLIALPARKVIDYGISLYKRTGKDTKLRTLIKKDMTKLAKSIGKISGKGIDITKFAYNNPSTTLLIVGLAVEQGIIKSKSSFLKNPQENLGRAFAWLFPDKIIKGIGKVSKGVERVALKGTQLKRFKDLNKVTKVAKEANLTAQQLSKLERAILRASNISNKVKRENKVRTALMSILKDRGINYKRGLSLKDLVTKVKSSKVQAIKVTKAKPKTITIKPKDKKITLAQLKKAKLETGGVVRLQKIKNKRKVITRYKIEPNGSFTKITKKEFDKIQRLAKAKQPKPKKKPKKEVIKLDVTELEKQTIEKNLKKNGVYKSGKVTYIDLNAVKRLETAKEATVKPVTKKGLLSNKKAQTRFSRQIQVSVEKETKKISKAKKDIKRKKITRKSINKTKAVLKKSKIKLGILLNLARAIKAATLIKKIRSTIKSNNNVIKRIEKVMPAIKIKPATKIKPASKVKPATKIKTSSKVGQGIKTKPLTKAKSISKPISKLKPVIKSKPITKPKEEKRLKPRRLPKLNFDSNILNNRVVTYEAKFRERRNKNKPFNKKSNPIITKTIKKTTTKNRMLKIVADKADNSLVRSMKVKVTSVTNRKIKDIKKPQVLNKFRQKKSKNTPVLELVEKSKSTLDTPGEKREAKLKRKQKSKKKAPSKRVSKVSKAKKKKKSSKKRRK